MTKIKIMLLFPHEGNYGGVVNFYAQVLPEYSLERYEVYKFRVGKVEKSNLLRLPLVRMFDLMAGYSRFVAKCVYYKPQIIHINPSYNQKAIYRDFLFFKLGRLFSPSSKILVHFRGWDPVFYNSTKRCDLIVRKQFIQGADAIIVLAQEFKKEIRKVVNRENIFVIPTTSADFDYARKKENDSNTLHFLFIARMEKEKGIYDLLEAAKKMKSDPGSFLFHLDIAGDGGEMQQVKQIIIDYQLQAQTTLHGYVKGKIKEALFLNADIFIFPSYHDEGCPNAIIEALAAGLPIVTTSIGAIADLITENINGLFIKSHNYKDIAEKLKIISEDKTLRSTMALANRNKYITELSPAKIFSRIDTVYSQLLADK